MHHPTSRIAHTIAYAISVVEQLWMRNGSMFSLLMQSAAGYHGARTPVGFRPPNGILSGQGTFDTAFYTRFNVIGDM